MRAYSQELRYQVLRAVDEGISRAEVIERFQVSRATIKRYLKQRRETGNVLPRPIAGRPSRKLAALLMGVQALLEAHPEASACSVSSRPMPRDAPVMNHVEDIFPLSFQHTVLPFYNQT